MTVHKRRQKIAKILVKPREDILRRQTNYSLGSLSLVVITVKDLVLIKYDFVQQKFMYN